MNISKDSPASTVARTKCEKCGAEGYIFPDQLPKGVVLMIRDRWYSKCCNGRQRNEKRSEIRYFIDSARALRLQAIRRRNTTIDEETAVSFD